MITEAAKGAQQAGWDTDVSVNFGHVEDLLQPDEPGALVTYMRKDQQFAGDRSTLMLIRIARELRIPTALISPSPALRRIINEFDGVDPTPHKFLNVFTPDSAGKSVSRWLKTLLEAV